MSAAYKPTSRDAWRSFLPLSAELDRAIMDALAEKPRTCQEIEDRICREHQSVSANLRHAVEAGLVEASGEYGKTRSGRRAIIWSLTAFADTGLRPIVQELLPL